MVSVDFDLEGRLLRFSANFSLSIHSAVPSDQDRLPDWSPLFAAARLDPAVLAPITPQSTPRIPTDAQVAWTGSYKERPDLPLRLEAGSFRGRIVFFEIVAPWTGTGQVTADTSGSIARTLVNLALILAVAFFAYLNWKSGRADIPGASKLGLYFFVLTVMLWLLASHHPRASLALQSFVVQAMPRAFAEGAIMFALYLAIEPWGRRLWPRAMITWSRVLTGRWRDPQVGRDVLIGLLMAVVGVLLVRLIEFNTIRLGGPPVAWFGQLNTEDLYVYLLGSFGATLVILSALMAIAPALILTASLLMFQALLRNKWLAAACFFALFDAASFQAPWITVLGGVLGTLVLVWVIYRFGLFVLAIMQCGAALISAILTTDFTMWYGPSSLAAVIAVSAFALVGFRLSLLGRSLWSDITNAAAIGR
jgi:serine/threonine-protein kinase